MDTRIAPQELARTLQSALVQGLIGSQDTGLIVYDLDRLRARLREACQAFPEGTLHALAVKANPLPKVLLLLAAVDPCIGAEVASLPELELALRAGFEPRRILFDSPAKTGAELRLALERGVNLNADGFQELERIHDLLAGLARQGVSPAGSIGLRVNPQVGAGAIAATSVAGHYSKFGVPVAEFRAEIIAAFGRHPWLTGLHAHVGSQGCSLEQLCAGARTLVDLAEEINDRSPGRVRLLDIGGGLPATYDAADPKPSISDYGVALRQSCPELWSGRYGLVTEFGRAVHANAAFAASRVEYVKVQSGVVTAVTHLGADLFLRKCYNPGDWHHDVLGVAADGRLKAGQAVAQTIAGPLCFQGDLPARDVPLPLLEQGDWVCFRDVGAYTLSMWSRYNSRQMPLVLGLSRKGGQLRFTVLRPRETVEQVLRFWD
ncbi:MAG: diaminopimelate decarboxylase [Proteobacteria bacterium]|nr:diaminopimelate decarboxylase [Pseudomonadota bacterium]